VASKDYAGPPLASKKQESLDNGHRSIVVGGLVKQKLLEMPHKGVVDP